MASVESTLDQIQANMLGWRTFRIISATEPMIQGEILCPASEEAGKRTTCSKCGLCDGHRFTGDNRKSIGIYPHGVGADNVHGD